MQLRKDDEYGLFQAQSPNCGRIQIKFEKCIHGDCKYEEVTTYLNGRVIDHQEFYEEEDYDNYEETDNEIKIRVCGDNIYIDKLSMVRINQITNRNEFIINNASTRNKLCYKKEKVGWDNIATFINEAKNKGYDFKQIKELTENILEEIKEK